MTGYVTYALSFPLWTIKQNLKSNVLGMFIAKQIILLKNMSRKELFINVFLSHN